MSQRAVRAGEIAVEAGQLYRCRRPGAPARYIRVERVSRASGRTPTATVVELTRTGRPKRGGVRALSALTWRDEAWRLRAGYELVLI